MENTNINHFIHKLIATDHFLIYTNMCEEDGIYVFGSASLRGRPRLVRDMFLEAYAIKRDNYGDSISLDGESTQESSDEFDEPSYLLFLSPSDPFFVPGQPMELQLPKVHIDLDSNRVRLVADGTQTRLALAKNRFTSSIMVNSPGLSEGEDSDEDPTNDDATRTPSQFCVQLHCLVEQRAHLPNVNRELREIMQATDNLAETIVGSIHQVRGALQGAKGYQELLQNWYVFASDQAQHGQRMDTGSHHEFARMLTKLAISWVAFICNDCDPSDRKTFRWAVTALEFVATRTHGDNILHIHDDEFAILRQKVASSITLLISHFDVLEARSRKEQEQLAGLMRTGHSMDRDSLSIIGLSKHTASLSSEVELGNHAIQLRWKQRVDELDARRFAIESQQRSIGRVIDEENLDDKSLLFLASSTSNVSIRWQQGKSLGSGAFGSVYQAVNLDSGTLMAVKEIKSQHMNSSSNLYQQIKDELSVMEILQHPNIIEYYGIEVHRDKVYIFEEYCGGGDLATLLTYGRIENENILQIYAMQILDALAYLHSQGVVHRDVKPDSE